MKKRIALSLGLGLAGLALTGNIPAAALCALIGALLI